MSDPLASLGRYVEAFSDAVQVNDAAAMERALAGWEREGLRHLQRQTALVEAFNRQTRFSGARLRRLRYRLIEHLARGGRASPETIRKWLPQLLS